MLDAPDSTIGQPPALGSTVPQAWYMRGPIASRLGSSAEDRYTLAGGCFALSPADGDGSFLARDAQGYAADAPAADGEVFRFQPTDLGSYLLLGPEGRFPARQGGELAVSEGPSHRAEWVITGDAANGFELTSPGGDAIGVRRNGELSLGDSGDRFALQAAAGCAAFPEIEVNATGRPRTGSPKYGQAKGTIDLHSHIMAFEAFGRGLHCGRPWHPLGVEAALVDCPDHAPNGLGGLASNMLVFQDPAHMHDPGGWPSFTGWPTYDWVFTHEMTYYRWIERSWRAGLRLVTLLAVDNSAACLVNVHQSAGCNEMDAVRRQVQATKDLQDYIDAQWGGPGQGFFRIVRNPYQARRVINRGKLAVILGMEVSEPLDCGLRNGVPQCDEDDVDTRLDELYKSGVRQMEVVNKFDNAFSGVAMDGGFNGPVINSANKITTGEFWEVETCTGPDEDREQITSVPPEAAALIALMPGGSLQIPAYPAAPHCNVKGLSDLGRYLIREMVKRKIVFDPDHMSVLARRHALDLIDGLDYSGIVSSHSWGDATSYKRIMELGGLVTPMAGQPQNFDNTWQNQRELYRDGKRSRRYGFGFGFADDMNGFGGPRNPTAGTDAEMTYPFNSPIDKGIKLDRQQSGTRTYDLNSDGVAHFGQWPDWTEAVRTDAGNRVIRDLRNGVESYLRMWERTVGIRGPHRMKKHSHFSRLGMSRLKLGMRPKELLRSAGQPDSRTRGWRWRARKSRGAKVGAAFGGARVKLIASTARGYRAAGIRPGNRTTRLNRVARPLGGGLWVKKATKRNRFLFGTKGGRVSFVGVGTPKATNGRKGAARFARLALGRR